MSANPVPATISVNPENQTRRSEGSFGCNLSYLLSLPGVLKLGQIVLGFVFCFLAGIFCGSYQGFPYCGSVSNVYVDGFAGQGFVLLVSSVCFLCSLGLFIIHIFGLNETITRVPWILVEIIYTFTAILLYFIANCIQSAYANNMKDEFIYGQWVAAAFFGWIIFGLYVLDAILQYMSRR